MKSAPQLVAPLPPSSAVAAAAAQPVSHDAGFLASGGAAGVPSTLNLVNLTRLPRLRPTWEVWDAVTRRTSAALPAWVTPNHITLTNIVVQFVHCVWWLTTESPTRWITFVALLRSINAGPRVQSV